MYMKLNNARKNMWLRAQTANQKFKQNAQIQDADGMQVFFSVIYDSVRCYTSTKILLMGGGGHQALSPIRFR